MFIVDLHPVLRNICGSVAFFVLGGVSHIRIADCQCVNCGSLHEKSLRDCLLTNISRAVKSNGLNVRKLFDGDCGRHAEITYSCAFEQKQFLCSTSASLLNTFWARWSGEPLPSTEQWTVNRQIGGQCRGAWLTFGTRKEPLTQSSTGSSQKSHHGLYLEAGLESCLLIYLFLTDWLAYRLVLDWKKMKLFEEIWPTCKYLCSNIQRISTCFSFSGTNKSRQHCSESNRWIII